MISSLSIDKKGNVLHDSAIRDFTRLKKTSSALWIDIAAPAKGELGVIGEIFAFHPLAIEDATRVVELPKIDDYKDYLFVVFHKIDLDARNETIRLKEMDFFLGPNYLITNHNEESPVISQIKLKLEKNPEMLHKGVDFLMHCIMDDIVDNYFPLLNFLEDHILKIEEDITKGKTNGILDRIIKLKRELSKLKRSLGPQMEIVGKLSKEEYSQISEKAALYFKDVYDHIFRIYSTLESFNDLTTTVFDAHLSSVSLKLNETSKDLNIVMQKLTLIATIFMPLTFIASVYGMNFDNMPELHWHYAYFGIMLFMLAIAVVIFLFFRKKHLL